MVYNLAALGLVRYNLLDLKLILFLFIIIVLFFGLWVHFGRARGDRVGNVIVRIVVRDRSCLDISNCRTSPYS